MEKIVKTFKFPNDSTEYQVNAVKLDGKTADELKTTVDSVMSDTSTNPVQNKAVKAYIDTTVKTQIEDIILNGAW